MHLLFYIANYKIWNLETLSQYIINLVVVSLKVHSDSATFCISVEMSDINNIHNFVLNERILPRLPPT